MPSGVLLPRRDLYRFPRAWAELAFNVRRWTEVDRGGHFFAMEQPALLAEDMFAFFHDTVDFAECVRTAPRPGAVRPASALDYALRTIAGGAAIFVTRSLLPSFL